jgi:hypothetical protein
LWEILPALAQVAFFFNPLVYLARYQTSLAREMACDALALKLTGASDSRYAKMLVDCVPGGRASVSSVGMAEAYGVLRARILSVANPILVSRPRLAVIWTLTAVVAITVIVPWMLTSERLQSSRRDLKPYRDSYDGLSIIPGEYKLNWELRDPEMRSSSRPTLVDSNMRAKIRGRLSSRAYHFDQDGFEAVIDQSHDSSKGYDVAYIFPEKWLHRGNVDLSATWRIPLLYEGTGPANDGFPVDLKLGRNTESTKKSGEFAIEAEIGPDGKPSEATLVWKGGWYGKVRTTKGEYEVEARDEDRDGRYNGTDSWECTPCNGCRHGLDQFQFADITTDSGSNSWFGESSEPALGVGMFAGKLYSFKVSSAGDSVYIEDYSGETGTIRLRSVDGFGRPAGFSAIFSGKNSKFVFSGRGKRDVEIPPGKYEVQVQVGVPDIHTKPDLANYYNNPFTYEYNSVKVTTGGTTPVNVGGKLTLEAFTNNRSFTTKHGVRKLMYVRLRAPQANNIFATWGPVKPISVRVLDRGGKAVQTSEMEWSGGFCTLTGQLDIGIFKPGDYTMVASYDFSPYSPEATVTAKIRVTE